VILGATISLRWVMIILYKTVLSTKDNKYWKLLLFNKFYFGFHSFALPFWIETAEPLIIQISRSKIALFWGKTSQEWTLILWELVEDFMKELVKQMLLFALKCFWRGDYRKKRKIMNREISKLSSIFGSHN